MNKKFGILSVVFLAVCIIGFLWFKKNQKTTSHSERIKRGTIVESVYGIGALTAEKSLSIKSGVTSTIHRLYVKEGEIVKKGALLVDLEGIGEFRAPFSGTIVSTPFKEGETVYAQTSVVTLVDPTDTYLLVTLEQQGALSLRPNLPVKISFDGLRGQVFDGMVESIFSNGVDFLSRISFKSLPKFILPGMTADVAIILQEKKDVLLIPVASLELKEAVLKRNGKTIRIPVKLGLVDGAYAEVIEGDVQVGDEAVLNQNSKKKNMK
ncbi:MAG: HlyD family efflux transporter periplasmic adaptor subunit [Bacteriovoracaceae bacterium]|nr:HlyD family efflux transporter periplasmic adaptor subunit [Bacteriovoracaceae bacterium]